jgi:hypothetical protein
MPFVVALLVVVVVVAIVLLVVARRPRQDAGVSQFQRHIDALSSEARREVIDRVQKTRDEDED